MSAYLSPKRRCLSFPDAHSLAHAAYEAAGCASRELHCRTCMGPGLQLRWSPPSCHQLEMESVLSAGAGKPCLN